MNGIAHLVDFVANIFLQHAIIVSRYPYRIGAVATHLQIPLNVTQQRHITNRRRDQQYHTPRKDQHRRDHRQQQQQGDQRVVPVRREVGRLEIVGVGEGVEGEGVDGLTGAVG